MAHIMAHRIVQLGNGFVAGWRHVNPRRAVAGLTLSAVFFAASISAQSLAEEAPTPAASLFPQDTPIYIELSPKLETVDRIAWYVAWQKYLTSVTTPPCPDEKSPNKDKGPGNPKKTKTTSKGKEEAACKAPPYGPAKQLNTIDFESYLNRRQVFLSVFKPNVSVAVWPTSGSPFHAKAPSAPAAPPSQLEVDKKPADTSTSASTSSNAAIMKKSNPVDAAQQAIQDYKTPDFLITLALVNPDVDPLKLLTLLSPKNSTQFDKQNDIDHHYRGYAVFKKVGKPKAEPITDTQPATKPDTSETDAPSAVETAKEKPPEPTWLASVGGYWILSNQKDRLHDTIDQYLDHTPSLHSDTTTQALLQKLPPERDSWFMVRSTQDTVNQYHRWLQSSMFTQWFDADRFKEMSSVPFDMVGAVTTHLDEGRISCQWFSPMDLSQIPNPPMAQLVETIYTQHTDRAMANALPPDTVMWMSFSGLSKYVDLFVDHLGTVTLTSFMEKANQFLAPWSLDLQGDIFGLFSDKVSIAIYPGESRWSSGPIAKGGTEIGVFFERTPQFQQRWQKLQTILLSGQLPIAVASETSTTNIPVKVFGPPSQPPGGVEAAPQSIAEVEKQRDQNTPKKAMISSAFLPTVNRLGFGTATAFNHIHLTGQHLADSPLFQTLTQNISQTPGTLMYLNVGPWLTQSLTHKLELYQQMKPQGPAIPFGSNDIPFEGLAIGIEPLQNNQLQGSVEISLPFLRHPLPADLTMPEEVSAPNATPNAL